MLADGEQAVAIQQPESAPVAAASDAEVPAATTLEQDRLLAEAAVRLLQQMAAEGRLPAGLPPLAGVVTPHGDGGAL